MTAPGGRPVPATGSRVRRRQLPLFFPTVTLLAFGLAAGCTFERRPQTQVNADPGQIQEPVAEEPASSFLEGFQAARSSGGEGELRAMLHPEASVISDGGIVPLDPDGNGDTDGGVDELPGPAWSVLARDAAPGGAGGVAPTVTDSVLFEGGAFFVLEYDDEVETLLLARDSAGWSLRILHRVTSDGRSR